ncbi:O-antigen ligase family protein [Shewanella sp. 5S214]|uniref:O-antigen ligase family protein n=1 Tax=Shewanella sp. 5S214 TaxID=3229999 RepID=UPI00352C55AA
MKFSYSWNRFLLSAFFIFIFLTQFTLRTPGFESRGIDFQVLARILFIYSLFFMISPSYRYFIKGLQYKPEFYLFLLLLLLLVTTLVHFSLYAIYTLTTLFITMFIVRFYINNFGVEKVFIVYVYFSISFALISFFFYFFFKDIGRYSYWQWGEFITSTRMQGVSGHPNTLAFILGINIVITVNLMLKKVLSNKISFLSIFLSLIVLFLCNSKTNILSVIICFFIFFIFRRKTYSIMLFLCSIIIVFFIITFVVMPEFYIDIIRSASRTGDINEILTFTGRSSIWSFVLDIIYQKIIFGWGYSSAVDVLVSNSAKVGFTVAQTHNLYLQILMSGGVICFIVFLKLIFEIISSSINNDKVVFLQLIFYILLVGFSEAIIFNTIANCAFIVFCIVVYGLSCDEKR